MTSFDRFEQRLPELFDELALPPRTDYLNNILARTVTTRQRPGWSFSERWLPMSALARRLSAVPRFPWRLAAAVALLLLAAILAVLIAGSGRARVPAPFGLADNGRIVFVDGVGRILTGDPETGLTTVVVDQPGNSRPVFSQDGTRLAFTRLHAAGGVDLLIADADGSDPRMLNADPMERPGYLAWSPRGDALVVTHDPGTLERYDTSRTAAPTILSENFQTGRIAIGYSGFNDRSAGLFRPPNGDELVFVSYDGGVTLRVARPDGTDSRDLLSQATSDLGYTDLKAAQWSPDGSQIVVMVEIPIRDKRWNHLYLINADGSNLRPLSPLSRDLMTDEGSPMWSPDGSRIAFQRWTNHADGSPEEFHPLAVVDVASGKLHDVGRVSNNGYASWEWSPDGASILAVPDDDSREVLVIDATTGTWTAAAWQARDAVSWQRTAP